MDQQVINAFYVLNVEQNWLRDLTDILFWIKM